jgi:hypothetical protein
MVITKPVKASSDVRSRAKFKCPPILSRLSKFMETAYNLMVKLDFREGANKFLI